MNEEIDSAIKRVRGYWFIDGFIEMATGGVFVLLAALLLLSGTASPASLPSWFLSIAGKVSIAKLGGIVAAALILWWLNDHFTYPRTGFVRGQRVTAAQVFVIARNILLFLLLPILALLGASLLLMSPNRVLAAMPVWFPVALGVFWAVLFVLSGEWLGLPRFRLVAALTLLAGIAVGAWQLTAGLPTLPASMPPGLSQPAVLESIQRTLASLCFLVLICGGMLLVSGLVTFLRYRKENPVPYAEDA